MLTACVMTGDCLLDDSFTLSERFAILDVLKEKQLSSEGFENSPKAQENAVRLSKHTGGKDGRSPPIRRKRSLFCTRAEKGRVPHVQPIPYCRG